MLRSTTRKAKHQQNALLLEALISSVYVVVLVLVILGSYNMSGSYEDYERVSLCTILLLTTSLYFR
jgi:hypothetical protein